jgi:hypothetical protein
VGAEEVVQLLCPVTQAVYDSRLYKLTLFLPLLDNLAIFVGGINIGEKVGHVYQRHGQFI